MPSKDHLNSVKIASARHAAAITTNTTTNGLTIDTQGHESLTFAVQSAAYTDGSYAVQLFAGDAANMSDEVVITTQVLGLLGTAPTLAAANLVSKVGYVGSKRYARLKIVSTGVTSGATVSAVAVLAHARLEPVA